MRKRILVVDDYASGLETVAKLLQVWGFETRTAANGHEALAALDEFVPDLVLLDWYMPIMSGASFLRQIRATKRWSHLPVIVFTAWDDPEERAQARELGAEVIPKNARACSAILESIQQHLAQDALPPRARREANENPDTAPETLIASPLMRIELSAG